ncbi:aspartate aminotransferase family protein [Corallococcus praedator]|uniref:Acetylornithine aminotransferase n=1 Tax=Corallococcus praedator TaxID=2316724 RepID=A0ABX9QLH1_9BACT|nr:MULTISPECIES: aspartate aminotransferase family protein [Corallococcus]RKH17640.1 aspartate aminotransferase family protein [Corallococcus sp. CA031C]RKI12517.1 aspartate aminotransferase family protein [Corallococcus praedator]
MQKAKQHLLQNYKQQPIALVRGQGTRVWDADGKAYLDCIGGIAVCALGHCHPEVVAAAKAQLDLLWHVSNVFYSQPQIDLAEQLTEWAGLPRAFFCNSGAEANEALIKLTRKVMKDRGTPERFELITFDKSFHGRTLATVTATGQPKYHAGFEPLPAGFKHVPYGDLEAVRRAVGPSTAAILVEPIQGEGGVRMSPPGFLQGLRALCDEHGLLLLVDEVQTGMGRTGLPFGFMHDGIQPDAISIAKALGNGLPMGAMLCREELAKSLTPGTHGSTFGGNLVSAAAANVVLRLLRQPGLLPDVQAKGEHFLAGARALQAALPEGRIKAVRGRGLLLGVELDREAAPVIAKLRDAGLLVNSAGDTTLRFAPPLIITRQELDEALGILQRVLASL